MYQNLKTDYIGLSLLVVLLVPGINAQAQTESPQIEEVTVFGRATKDTLASVPQTIEILNSVLIEDTRSETVGDVLRFIPGATRDGSPLDAFGDTFLIRGFESNQTINGLYGNSLRQARDSIGIERIEVLKGPASVIYGQLQPGAVVNIVTKQPEREFSGAADLSLGRFDARRGTVDLTGPLTENGDVRYRLTGAYDDSDSFVDYWHREHMYIAPVIAMDVGEDTTVTLEAFYTRNELDGFFNGLPAAGSVIDNPNGEFSSSLSLTDPTLDPSIREDGNVAVRVLHNFSDNVSWRTAVSWTHEDRDEANVLGVFGWDEEFRSLTRIVLDGGGKGDTWNAHTDVAVDFETGGLTHELVVGADHMWFDRKGNRKIFFAPSLDLFDPVYAINEAPELTESPGNTRLLIEENESAGVFLQDRITLNDRIKLIGGVRWSRFSEESRTIYPNEPLETSDSQEHSAWTSQLGILFQAADNLALFANRTTSFLPSYGIAADASALEPETGEQYEIGARAELADGLLAINASLFHLTRGDIVVSDRDNPGFEASIGEQVAKGIELSLNANPVPGFNIYAGYAYTDAKTTEDTDETLNGLRIRNIPEHSLVLRSEYEWLTGSLAGLTFGSSATYSDTRPGDLNNSFNLPDYWRIDASLSYPIAEGIVLGTSIQNLTDEQFYDYAYSEFEVWPGAPRTWQVFLKAGF